MSGRPLEYRVLGPIEVVDRAGRARGLGGPKQRLVLALLVVRRNEVVSVDRLLTELWGEEPPRSAATMLHGYVSKLRCARRRLVQLVAAGLGDPRLVADRRRDRAEGESGDVRSGERLVAVRAHRIAAFALDRRLGHLRTRPPVDCRDRPGTACVAGRHGSHRCVRPAARHVCGSAPGWDRREIARGPHEARVRGLGRPVQGVARQAAITIETGRARRPART